MPHLTPTDLARELGLERRDVVAKCLDLGVPVYQGRVDADLFKKRLGEAMDARALSDADRAEALQLDAIARSFHDAYERLAPQFGYRTREASAKPWDDVPNDNKRLMRATVRDLLNQGVIVAGRPAAQNHGESR
jgi:hypothetical protein